MTGQSGFLNSFLQFLKGDEGEPLTKPIKRQRQVRSPPPIAKKEEAVMPEKIKRRPGRPRKIPKVKNKLETEELKSETDGSSAEVTNDLEASGSIDSDSQSMKKDMVLEMLKENFNKCVNEKVEFEESNVAKEVIERLDDDNTQNGKNVTVVSEETDNKTERNKVDLPLRSDERKNSIDEASNCSEKEKQDSVISNLTDRDENVSFDSQSESNIEESKSMGRKRKKKTEVQEQIPRRELSARKAKQKPKFSYIESESEDNPDFDDESNSDNDPVWTPNEKKASSDEEDNFQWKERQMQRWKSKKLCTAPPVKNELKQEVKMVPIDKKSEIKNEVIQSKSTLDSSSMKKDSDVLDVKKVPTPAARMEVKDAIYQYPTHMPFQSGSFIALKKELEDLEEPNLWRVDGKALLQKYEPYRGDDGSLRYRNVSTYSGWGPKNRTLYQPVPVRFLYQNRFEYIVEIIKEDLIINDDKLREKLVKDLEKHNYAYEVYLQTLVSQALDSNFLNEIVTEKEPLLSAVSALPQPRSTCISDQISIPTTDDPTDLSKKGDEEISSNDEYFITSLGEMDAVCDEKKRKLLQVFGWNKELKESLSTWPTLIIKTKDKDAFDSNCHVCCKFSYFCEISLEGEVYSNKTLEFLPSSIGSQKFKTFLACKTCLENVQLFNQIAHLKYHTYNICVELVMKKKTSDESKDNTTILHDILADSEFITKKFHEVTLLWAEADLKCRKKKSEEIVLI